MAYRKFFFFLLFPLIGLSQVSEYYSSIDFTAPSEGLKTQLTTLVTESHKNELRYTPQVWQVLKLSDIDISNPEKVLLIYGYDDNDNESKTDRSRLKNDNCTSNACTGLWNREHVFPVSLANPRLDTSYPGAGTDVHNLRACDSQMNSSRGNRKFAAGSGNSGITSNGDFFPGDEWKGDVARIIMYNHLRYPGRCEATSVGVGSVTYSTMGDMPDIFLKWNAEDPVSKFEMQRNEVIANFQGNRNPFIDNPYLASMIWNGPKAEDKWNIHSVSEPTIETPAEIPGVSCESVKIEISENRQLYYVVYNIKGQKVNTDTISTSINMCGYNSGLYFIKLHSEEKAKKIMAVLR